MTFAQYDISICSIPAGVGGVSVVLDRADQKRAGNSDSQSIRDSTSRVASLRLLQWARFSLWMHLHTRETRSMAAAETLEHPARSKRSRVAAHRGAITSVSALSVISVQKVRESELSVIPVSFPSVVSIKIASIPLSLRFAYDGSGM